MCKKDRRELNKYRSLGKPEELAKPVFCRECRHVECVLPYLDLTNGHVLHMEYRCSLSRLWMRPNDYCSRGCRE